MVKKIAILMLMKLYLHAFLFDFLDIQKADKAYKNRDYQQASKLYSKIEGDQALFNKADSLYKQKRFKDALELYKKIKNKNLEHKKLHNIGNCYANLNKIDDAIKSYEKALKIKEDKDTRYNLNLLKKKKRQNKNKKDQNKNKKDQNKNKKDQNKNKKDQNKNKKDQNKNKKDQNKNKKDQNKNKKTDKEKQDKNSKKDKQINKNREQKRVNIPPISDMEERKWKKMLNKRGVNTLLLPLNKGDKKHETNPW